jgi:diphthamide synthase subunit DPH2
VAIGLQHPRGLAQVRLKVLHMLCAQLTVASVQQCLVQCSCQVSWGTCGWHHRTASGYAHHTLVAHLGCSCSERPEVHQECMSSHVTECLRIWC